MDNIGDNIKEAGYREGYIGRDVIECAMKRVDREKNSLPELWISIPFQLNIHMESKWENNGKNNRNAYFQKSSRPRSVSSTTLLFPFACSMMKPDEMSRVSRFRTVGLLMCSSFAMME